MGLLKSVLGVPENKSISEEFNDVFFPEVHPDYKESYEVADQDIQRENERRRKGYI